MRFFSGPGPAGLQFLGNLKIEGKTLGVDVVGQRIAVGRRTLAALGMRRLRRGRGERQRAAHSRRGEQRDNRVDDLLMHKIEWMVC